MTRDQNDAEWHLDKKVPLALIGSIALQTVLIVWWASNASTRLDALEKKMDASAPQSERLVRVETKMDGLSDALKEVKSLLQKDPRT